MTCVSAVQVHEATIEAGAYPSPLNYYNFPKSVCTSVNEVSHWQHTVGNTTALKRKGGLFMLSLPATGLPELSVVYSKLPRTVSVFKQQCTKSQELQSHAWCMKDAVKQYLQPCRYTMHSSKL